MMQPNSNPLHGTPFTKLQMFEFLDLAMLMGDINSSTGQSWKSAAKAILAGVGDQDDIRKVDIAAEAGKLKEEDGFSLSPVTVRTYASRTESLVKEYIAFLGQFNVGEPPAPSLGTAATILSAMPKSPPPAEEAGISADKLREVLQASRARKYSWSRDLQLSSATSQLELTVPFPLRPDFTVQVVIPRNLSKAEADRLCNFIQAMAQAE
jgi:hypothetical protein